MNYSKCERTNLCWIGIQEKNNNFSMKFHFDTIVFWNKFWILWNYYVRTSCFVLDFNWFFCLTGSISTHIKVPKTYYRTDVEVIVMSERFMFLHFQKHVARTITFTSFAYLKSLIQFDFCQWLHVCLFFFLQNRRKNNCQIFQMNFFLHNRYLTINRTTGSVKMPLKISKFINKKIHLHAFIWLITVAMLFVTTW